MNKIAHIFKSLAGNMRKPYIIFLVIGAIFGLFYLISVPAIGEPDEAQHFNRIYQITEGHPFGQIIPGGKGSYLPKAIYSFDNTYSNRMASTTTEHTSISNIWNLITKPSTTIINSGTAKKLTHFENTELYNPVSYTPQAIAMFAAKLLNFSVPKTFYLVRLAGLTAWLAICAYGIKKMRVFGWAACVLLLTPLSIQIASAVSADSMAVAISVLFVGEVVDALATKNVLSRRQLTTLLITTILLACAKLPYILLAALLLVLPSYLFKNGKKEMIRYLAITLATIFIVVIGWTIVAQKGYTPYRAAVAGVPINQATQEKFMLEHPLSFGRKLSQTYIQNTAYNQDPVLGYVGQLASLDYYVPGWTVALYFILLSMVFMALRSGAKIKEYLSVKIKLLSLGIAILLFVAVNVLVFISWSQISFPGIDGIQSRYFIPVLLPFIFCLLPLYKKDISLSRTFYISVPVSLIIIQLAAVTAVYNQFL